MKINNKEIYGFGANATGGTIDYYVTHAGDSGEGSLRYGCEADAPYIINCKDIKFINLMFAINIKSNKTINGDGLCITGNGLTIKNSTNIIINDVIIQDVVSDCISIRDKSENIVVANSVFRRGVDGLLDITKAATNVTVAYCKFLEHDKCMLIGGNANNTEDTCINVTLHDNVFNKTNQRHPKIRFGKVHIFNNKFILNTDYLMQITEGAEALIENNYFLLKPFVEGVFEYDGEKSVGYSWIRDNKFNIQYLPTFLDFSIFFGSHKPELVFHPTYTYTLSKHF